MLEIVRQDSMQNLQELKKARMGARWVRMDSGAGVCKAL